MSKRFIRWDKRLQIITKPLRDIQTGSPIMVVVVVVDSHIQRIVLATEETTVTHKSAIDSSHDNPACGHKEAQRSTGHIMVTTRYSDQQGSKS